MNEKIYSIMDDLTDAPFGISLAAISHCDGSYHIVRNESSVTCMGYVISGKGVITTREMTVRPEEGDVFILHKEDDHVCAADPSEPWEIAWFTVDGSLVEHLLMAYGLENVIHVKGVDAQELFEEFVQNACQNPEQATELNALVFHRILRRIAERMIPAETGDALRIKSYLDAHVCEQVTVEELAKLIGRSPSQTIRIFKSAYGQTPYNYSLDRRIGAAKLMLEESCLSVKEIARQLCFADEHYFSNIFKQKTGLSPRSYRMAPEKNEENIPVYML